MNVISFFNKTNKEVVEQNILEKLIDYAVAKEDLNNVEFGVIFVNNDEIKELNKRYRNIDKETDVLTFALEDNDDYIYEDYRLLGDIYISLDKAYGQAIEYNHSYLRELAFLMIHGFLHLLGYDHIDKDDEKIMNDKEEEILNGFNIQR